MKKLLTGLLVTAGLLSFSLFTNGVCILGRDVFLDSTKDVEQVKANLRKAAEIAGKNGSAVAIGHVGPEGGKTTAEAIAALIPELEDAGIEFVTVGELAK